MLRSQCRSLSTAVPRRRRDIQPEHDETAPAGSEKRSRERSPTSGFDDHVLERTTRMKPTMAGVMLGLKMSIGTRSRAPPPSGAPVVGFGSPRDLGSARSGSQPTAMFSEQNLGSFRAVRFQGPKASPKLPRSRATQGGNALDVCFFVAVGRRLVVRRPSFSWPAGWSALQPSIAVRWLSTACTRWRRGETGDRSSRLPNSDGCWWPS